MDKLKLIAIIWFVDAIVCLSTFSVAFCIDLLNFITSYSFCIVFSALHYSIPFSSWMVSMNFTENIKMVRNLIAHNNDKFMTANFLNKANEFMTINYRKIHKVNQYLAFGFITSSIGIIIRMLQFVYMAVVFLKHFLTHSPVFYAIFSIQFILNCFINGIIHDETQRLINDLDEININVIDSELYRSLISLKISIQESKSRFTVGGFA